MCIKYVLMLITLMVVGCTKEEDKNSSEKFETSWVVGGDHSSDTTVVVPAVDGIASLIISDYSICPNQQLTVVVTTVDDEELFKFQTDSAFVRQFNATTSDDLSIRTHLTPTSRDIVCVWLGQATITYKSGD